MLLIGLGNPHRGDDGAGSAVARLVAAVAPGDVTVLEVDDPVGLIELWDGADLVVVVDAMISNREPGSVVVLDVTTEPLPTDGWAAGGTHALGLSAAVELSRALGRLPDRLLVVGVEAATVAPGTGLSPPVATAIGAAARTALRLLGSPYGDLCDR
jgi:hydrogenase maturation protease